MAIKGVWCRMDIEKITIAAISAITGGFIGYLFDRLKEMKKNKKEALNKIEEQRKARPEFVIIDMKDFFDYPGEFIDNSPCDIEIFVAGINNVSFYNEQIFVEYDNSILDKKTWVCRQYTLKNIGKTAVYVVDIISNYKKDTCIFDVNTMEYVVRYGVLNYYKLLDKRIAPDECFTLKLCYNKDKIIVGTFSAIFEIGMRDDNNVHWVQPFFAPDNKLYESRRISYKEYRESLMPDTAIKCFRNPMLW